ncbi:MAG TPA: hypothetical protein VFR85_19170, partial [Anaeromyxobacteraceae bacterium]|nr:hypothetical protein [Anaeromyxobacteraceae bacterium]
LRADVFRQWLFAEVEPEVVWPADPPRGYRTVLGIILRLEVLFVSEARPADAPAPSEAAQPAKGPPAPAPTPGAGAADAPPPPAAGAPPPPAAETPAPPAAAAPEEAPWP